MVAGPPWLRAFVTARAAAEVAAAADVPMTMRVASSRWACRSAAVQRSRDRAAGRRARPSVLPRSRRPEPARIAGRTRGCDPAGLEGFAQGLLPEPPGTLPLATPGPGDTVALLGALRKIPVPRLRAALRGNEPADVAGELRGIVAELAGSTGNGSGWLPPGERELARNPRPAHQPARGPWGRDRLTVRAWLG